MRYRIQVLAPSFMHVIIFPLEEDLYQKEVELSRNQLGSRPISEDLTSKNIAHAEYYVIPEFGGTLIKILDENDDVVSDFKLHEITDATPTGSEDEIYYDNKYFWEKHSKNKPCYIERRYNDDMDLEFDVMWEHEIEADNVPKKKDFEYTKSIFASYHKINKYFLEESKSILYKKNPIVCSYYPMIAEDGPNIGNNETFFLDYNGKPDWFSMLFE